MNKISTCDLKALDIKTDLLSKLKNKDILETDLLVEIIKKMSKIDERYLKQQLSQTDSPFFKIIREAFERKTQKEKRFDLEKKDEKNSHLNKKSKFRKSFSQSIRNRSQKKIRNEIVSQRVERRVCNKRGNSLAYQSKPKHNLANKITLNINLPETNTRHVSLVRKPNCQSLNNTRKIIKTNRKERKVFISIMNKSKKKSLSKKICIKGVSISKRKEKQTDRIMPKIAIQKHVTLNKGQLNSMIKNNFYIKMNKNPESSVSQVRKVKNKPKNDKKKGLRIKNTKKSITKMQ